MLNPRVSIIIPVYNGEDFIGECLDSLMAQTLDSIEFLVINDGSTDNTAAIISDKVSDEPRFFVIHTNNQGVSIARNTGIQCAKGDYIGFVDSDDLVDKEMFRRMAECAVNSESDLIICDIKRKSEGKIFHKDLKLHSEVLSGPEYRSKLLRDIINYKYTYSCWNKLYKREIITENQIFFNNRVKWGEDLLFNMEYCLSSHRGCIVEDDLYYYNERDNTHSQARNENSMLMQTDHIMGAILEKLILPKYSSEYRAFKKPFAGRYYSLLMASTFQALVQHNKIQDQYISINTLIRKTSFLSPSFLNYLDKKSYSFNHQIKIFLLTHHLIGCYAFSSIVYYMISKLLKRLLNGPNI